MFKVIILLKFVLLELKMMEYSNSNILTLAYRLGILLKFEIFFQCLLIILKNE